MTAVKNVALMTFRLDDEFIAGYAKKTPPFGFNGLGELVYLRTYSRLKEDGTNEQWFETVRRVVEGTYSMQRRWIVSNGLYWNERKAQRSAQEMYDRIFTMKFLPPGRGLWAMGSPLTEEKGIYAALWNCFSGDTQFVTDRGAVRFEDVVGETVNVLNRNGVFSPAEVREFGEQQLFQFAFRPTGRRSNLTLTVEATENHRWILADGSETTALKVGDAVQTQCAMSVEDAEYRAGFLHGLMFGDGTQNKYYPDRYTIQLCGRKQQYRELLEAAPGYTSTLDKHGDPVITVRSTLRLKELPTGVGAGYVAGFIRGWIATDGWTKPSGSICLDTQDASAAAWLVDHAPYAGLIATGAGLETRATNFGPRSAPLQRISLSAAQATMTVVEKEPTRRERVFCVVEPQTHTFTLAGGLLTGNCAFVSTANLAEDMWEPFTFLMDASMLGIGVGFDTKGAGQLVIQNPKGATTIYEYQIPDTREGWVNSVQYLLRTYFDPDAQKQVTFDYSLIRPAGAPIKGFGGIAAGPEPLRQLHDAIVAILDSCVGQPISVTNIVDLMNLIGKCVVAGNVRRTAEIAFGEPDSGEFLDLKNYVVNPHRAEYGWTSNNSIFAELGMDYSAAAERIRLNGEPGFAWLENMRAYSRMADDMDFKDARADGTNPCVEQTLESYECCCLVETFPGRHESLQDYLRTLKFAYLYGKTVTLGNSPWPRTNAVMLRNRRIGLSQSGIVQTIQKLGIERFREWCEEGYETVQEYDRVYSEWMAIPRSIKTTSVKPSGSVSLLAGATPGLHFPESKTYVRRMRLSKYSDLVQPLLEAGYPIEPAVGSEDTTVVVEIPVRIEDDVREASEVSMWEQLALAAFMQRYWADNQVSATITFDPNTEGHHIAHALNFYQYQLKGISFLPRTEKGAYAQMPYEAITDVEYEKRVAALGKLQFGQSHEEAEAEKYCTNDSCSF